MGEKLAMTPEQAAQAIVNKINAWLKAGQDPSPYTRPESTISGHVLTREILSVIQTAVLSERERCAQIAMTPGVWNELPFGDDGQCIATAIRSGTEVPKASASGEGVAG